jgi:methylthioxylose transferase
VTSVAADLRAAEPRAMSEGTGAVTLWALLIGAAAVWGAILLSANERFLLGVPPLMGRLDPRVGGIAIPATLAVLALWLAPRLAATLPWRQLLWASFAAAAAWAMALALVDGPSGLVRPLESRFEYLHDVPLVGSPGAFLGGFVDDIDRYTTHVRSHPPGFMLALWSLDRLGLGGSGAAAALVIAGGAAAAPAVLVALRETTGEAHARTAAPFVALAPAAIWIATSADALFAGVAAWSAALTILATGDEGSRSDALALAGGLLFGAALVLSYGVALLVLVPLTVALARRRLRPIAVAAVGTTLVLLTLGAAGFWWPEGLSATRREYADSIARFRPYAYFLVANMAAFAVAVGPATAAALARLRHPGVWLLAGGALASIAVANFSGLSKGEVERIWLPFAPWVIAACAGLSAGTRRVWLAAQLSTGLIVQSLIRTSW